MPALLYLRHSPFALTHHASPVFQAIQTRRKGLFLWKSRGLDYVAFALAYSYLFYLIAVRPLHFPRIMSV